MVTVGGGKFRYALAEGWGKLPAGWAYKEVSGVAVDSRDRVYLFTRGEHPVIVYDRDGNFLAAWGEGMFPGAHGITIDPGDHVWLTDNANHTVRKFTSEGKLLMTLGTPGQGSDTGVTGNWTTVKRGGPPFNRPTNVGIAPDGSLYITDGYGNARVHHFSTDGRLLRSWGEPGSGPGQFMLPHGVRVASNGTVYVADRENARMQLFTPDGKHLATWTHVVRPDDLWFDGEGNLFTAELGNRVGRNPSEIPAGEASIPARVQVLTLDGTRIGGWGGEQSPCAPGDFFAPHGICADSRGDLYVSEVTYTAGISRGLAPPDCHTFQKFVRL
jgi:sugar lactone lactonase YvrE